MPPRGLVVVGIALLAGLAGCTKSATERIARFHPRAAGADGIRTAAPATSLYKVKYAGVTGGGLKTVPGSRRAVEFGQPLGFRTGGDGTLLAVAGEETFPLDLPADRVHRVVWCRRVKKPRQFFVETGRVTRVTLEGAGYVALKLAEAGIEAGIEAALDDDDDECEDDDSGARGWGGGRNRQHHHRGGGGGGDRPRGSKPLKPAGGGESGKPVRAGSQEPERPRGPRAPHSPVR